MRKHFIALFLLTVFACASSYALAAMQDDKHKEHAAPTDAGKDAKKADAKPVTNKECPVSGGPVSEKYRTEYKGQYVYVCCQGCLDEFKRDAEKVVAKMSASERELIKKNELCPMSKEPVKDEFRVEDKGRLVYFCCAGCQSSYQKKMAQKATD